MSVLVCGSVQRAEYFPSLGTLLRFVAAGYFALDDRWAELPLDEVVGGRHLFVVQEGEQVLPAGGYAARGFQLWLLGVERALALIELELALRALNGREQLIGALFQMAAQPCEVRRL